MFFQIKSYLKFLWYSKNEHAVHSPFVFNLVSKCFYDKELKSELIASERAKQYQILKEYRNSLLKDTNTIEVTDFGAGSKVFKKNTRSVKQIAKIAGISAKRAELLLRITQYFQPKSILEIGTSLGLATAALALGSRSFGTKTSIITLEGCPETAKIAQLHLAKLSSRSQSRDNINNVELVVTEFINYLENGNLKTKNCQLIFFDGNHSKNATLAYFELLLPTICNQTLWIFDDIHWSQDMEEAWEAIKKHPKVTVTIDTFQWGMVFFRKEQPKQHFVIRV